ncbi:MAG: hypothetical protein ACRCXM_10555 [Beijerinckiaceae bacterium]
MPADGMRALLSAKLDGLARRPPLLYQHYRRLLTQAEGWTEDRRLVWMNARLAEITRKASALPGYQGHTARAPADWRPLAKAKVLGREADFMRRTLLPAARASTGGTTGSPLSLRRNPAAIVFEQAAIDHVCAQAGLAMETARVAVLRADFIKPPADMTPPFWRLAGPDRLLLSSFHLAPSTIRAYAGAIATFRPDVLMCYPSALGHWLALLREAGQDIRIPYILASSETLPFGIVEAARTALGATVIDYYGQAERVAASYGLNGAPHRMLPLYGYAERGEPLGDGHELMATSLWNTAMPLIRYRTGDMIMGEPDPLPSGSLPVSATFRIAGRGSERIALPDGRVLIGLNHLPRGVPGLVSLQVRRTGPAALDLVIVKGAGFGPASEAQIRANCALKIPPEVTITLVESAAPVRIASGKAPLLLPDGA